MLAVNQHKSIACFLPKVTSVLCISIHLWALNICWYENIHRNSYSLEITKNTASSWMECKQFGSLTKYSCVALYDLWLYHILPHNHSTKQMHYSMQIASYSAEMDAEREIDRWSQISSSAYKKMCNWTVWLGIMQIAQTMKVQRNISVFVWKLYASREYDYRKAHNLFPIYI